MFGIPSTERPPDTRYARNVLHTVEVALGWAERRDFIRYKEQLQHLADDWNGQLRETQDTAFTFRFALQTEGLVPEMSTHKQADETGFLFLDSHETYVLELHPSRLAIRIAGNSYKNYESFLQDFYANKIVKIIQLLDIQSFDSISLRKLNKIALEVIAEPSERYWMLYGVFNPDVLPYLPESSASLVSGMTHLNLREEDTQLFLTYGLAPDTAKPLTEHTLILDMLLAKKTGSSIALPDLEDQLKALNAEAYSIFQHFLSEGFKEAYLS
jgi:uncharacterized protein (TIGR04255 family)